MIVRRYQRCAEKEYGVNDEAKRDAEPEDRVEVAMSRILLISQCCEESAFLQVVSQDGEDGNHSDESDVGR